MKKVAIFASGNGSNAQRIMEYFKERPLISIELILTNNKEAFVIERAKVMNVGSVVFTRSDFYDSQKILELLIVKNIDFIVLAGFLWLVPGYLLHGYNGKIINIHPALLPKYGGKGMYGAKVHEAVIQSRDAESGITIHYVNEKYDAGQIIFQAKCPVEPNDTPESLAGKIHQLEYRYFPEVIEAVILDKKLGQLV